MAILTHDPAGRRDAAGTGDLCFPQCEAPGRRTSGLVEARGGSPHRAPESGWLGFLAFQGPSSPIAVDHGGVREKAAAGHPGRQSEGYHCPPDDFSRPKQIDVLVDLIERDRLDRVADLPLCSKGHDLAQVGVAAPERAVKGLFTRNPREQRDIDAIADQPHIDIVAADRQQVERQLQRLRGARTVDDRIEFTLTRSVAEFLADVGRGLALDADDVVGSILLRDGEFLGGLRAKATTVVPPPRSLAY